MNNEIFRSKLKIDVADVFFVQFCFESVCLFPEKTNVVNLERERASKTRFWPFSDHLSFAKRSKTIIDIK